MRTNYPTSYNPMDMGSPNFFSYNVDALVSMTNQQLEVRNELHMHSSRPRSPQGPVPHIPESSLLIVTAVSSWRCPLFHPAAQSSLCLGQQLFICAGPSEDEARRLTRSEPEGYGCESHSSHVFVKSLWVIVIKIWWFDSFPRNLVGLGENWHTTQFYLLWVQCYCNCLCFSICHQGKPITLTFLLKISEPYKPGATESHRGHKRAEDSATRITGRCDRQSGEFRRICVDRGGVPHTWAVLSHP